MPNPTPQDTEIEAILRMYRTFWVDKDAKADDTLTTPQARQKITALLTAARLDELRRISKVTAARKPNETWEAWCWRVLHYLKDRIKKLQAQEGTE